ncbi:MAG TPA: hypothetical protein VHC69_12755 [Polyangiaceae bacterium]|nr:hypothetical protein [Polyangiaceae bacterium]
MSAPLSAADALRALAQQLTPAQQQQLSSVYGQFGASGSYTPQQNGGVTGGGGGIGAALLGQNTTQVSPALISTLPDSGDAAAVEGAENDYQQKLAAYQQANSLQGHADEQQTILQIEQNPNHLSPTQLGDAITQEMARYSALTAAPPTAPDLSAVEAQSDRERLLNEASQVYQPLIQQQLGIATGTAPSAADLTYRAAAQDAQARAYGSAASINGTGGQRAALMQAAMGQAAQTQQTAATTAAQLRAQESNQAVQNVNQGLQGLTDIYGRSNLYGGTLQTQQENQSAQNNATNTNEQIDSANAAKKNGTILSYFKAAANAASGFG